MDRLGVLLKSYGQDFQRAQSMVASFGAHNRDGIPLFVVVPDDDLAAFGTLPLEPQDHLLPESTFADHLVDRPLWGLRPGYINQEIVKLAFWETGLVENYFCADSELEFVRDFGYADFMFDDATPYTVLVEDNELKVEPRYYEQHWRGREQHLRRIQDLVGLTDRRLLTCHGHQVMSAAVLQDLRVNLMEPRGWDYRDLLAESPYEFSWYNFWLQKSRRIPIEIREPLVKTFHHEGQEIEYALRGITTEDIARGFIGVVINSNYANAYGSDSVFEGISSPEEALARYVQPTTLARALAIQAKQSARRRLGRD